MLSALSIDQQLNGLHKIVTNERVILENSDVILIFLRLFLISTVF